jgi:hypothetical protein
MGPVAVAGDGVLLQEGVERGVDEAEEHVEDVEEGEDGGRERDPRPFGRARQEGRQSAGHDGRGWRRWMRVVGLEKRGGACVRR